MEVIAQLVFELLFAGTGKVVVMVFSLGRWQGESIFGKKSQIHCAAGALSFVRNGRRTITITGMTLAGFLFYIAVAGSFLAAISRT